MLPLPLLDGDCACPLLSEALSGLALLSRGVTQAETLLSSTAVGYTNTLKTMFRNIGQPGPHSQDTSNMCGL